MSIQLRFVVVVPLTRTEREDEWNLECDLPSSFFLLLLLPPMAYATNIIGLFSRPKNASIIVTVARGYKAARVVVPAWARFSCGLGTIALPCKP